MALVRMIAHGVFGCFWKMERLADRLTGKAGPVFVALAVILIAMSTVTYFNVIYPLAFLRPDCDALVALLSFLLSLYLATCTAIHYYLACTIPPGSPSEPTSLSRPFRTSRPWCSRVIRRLLHRPVRPTIGTGKQEMIEKHRMRINRYCAKCLKSGIKGIDGRGPIKPERAHHCRVCGICQLKYDHHCPWINQCVGLRNERYFLLFLLYMTVSCGWIVYWGWLPFMESLNFSGDWPFWSPRVCVVLTWVLALAIGVTIGIMFGWQLLLIGKGETTVESSDNDYYRKLFASRGQTYQNPFDLGLRSNLQLFFNTGPGRSRWITVLIPIRVAPSSDGWSWPKRAGWESQVIEMAEELTDDEDEVADPS